MSCSEKRRSVVKPRKANGKGTAGNECLERLKGLGPTILGNFSTDQVVIEFAKISK